MEQMVNFYTQYGWQLALIALIGIIILGVLKYANVFSNIAKEKRKPIYFAISLGFSVISSVTYLLTIGQFNIAHMIAVVTAIYALNQAMYSVYETTNLRDLVVKVLEYLFKKKKEIDSAKTEEESKENKQ